MTILIEKPENKMGGKLENFFEKIWFELTGLPREEAIVFSSHFHAMAFWSSTFPMIALLTGVRWISVLNVLLWITVVIAEAGSKGRWIDVISRGAGIVTGMIFTFFVL